MYELNESAGSKGKAEDQECEKRRVGGYKGNQWVRVKSGNNQNKRSWVPGWGQVRGEQRGGFYLECHQRVSRPSPANPVLPGALELGPDLVSQIRLG